MILLGLGKSTRIICMYFSSDFSFPISMVYVEDDDCDLSGESTVADTTVASSMSSHAPRTNPLSIPAPYEARVARHAID